MKTVFIYGLNDPRTGQCRYVGKATDCQKRWQAHIDRCRSSVTYKNCWIRGLLSLGLKPILEIIDEVPASEWEFWEQAYIRVFRAIGFDLTNVLPGGEGWPEGKQLSEETCAKMSAARCGKKHSAETRTRMRAAQRGRIITEAARQKIGIANTGRKRTEAVKNRHRENIALRLRDPVTGRLL